MGSFAMAVPSAGASDADARLDLAPMVAACRCRATHLVPAMMDAAAAVAMVVAVAMVIVVMSAIVVVMAPAASVSVRIVRRIVRSRRRVGTA